MSTPPLPIPRAGLLPRALGDELALFDVEAGIVHTLNPSAAVVWKGLVESHDRSKLVSTMKEIFAIDDGEAEQGIAEALEQFREAGLVEEG
jgi:PqqD family protein of HPr-rel-A system